MKKLDLITSIDNLTDLGIFILEIGWIESVFLIISPNLREILRLDEEPKYLLEVKHFEIKYLEDEHTYALKFFDSENTLIKGNTSNLTIERAKHIYRCQNKKKLMYSLFQHSHHFTEVSQYNEYCYFYQINGVSYLTDFKTFAVNEHN